MNKPEVIAFHHRYHTGIEETMNESAKVNGYELPKWLTDYVYNQMAFQYYKSFEFMYLSELSLKLKSGQFLRFYFRYS
jgi:hypothetical protein